MNQFDMNLIPHLDAHLSHSDPDTLFDPDWSSSPLSDPVDSPFDSSPFSSSPAPVTSSPASPAPALFSSSFPSFPPLPPLPPSMSSGGWSDFPSVVHPRTMWSLASEGDSLVVPSWPPQPLCSHVASQPLYQTLSTQSPTVAGHKRARPASLQPDTQERHVQPRLVHGLTPHVPQTRVLNAHTHSQHLAGMRAVQLQAQRAAALPPLLPVLALVPALPDLSLSSSRPEQPSEEQKAEEEEEEEAAPVQPRKKAVPKSRKLVVHMEAYYLELNQAHEVKALRTKTRLLHVHHPDLMPCTCKLLHRAETGGGHCLTVSVVNQQLPALIKPVQLFIYDLMRDDKTFQFHLRQTLVKDEALETRMLETALPPSSQPDLVPDMTVKPLAKLAALNSRLKQRSEAKAKVAQRKLAQGGKDTASGKFAKKQA